VEGWNFLPDGAELPPNISPGGRSHHPRLSLRGCDAVEPHKTYREFYDHVDIEVGQIQLQYTHQSMQLVQLLRISPVRQCIRPQKVRLQMSVPLTVTRFVILAAALLRIQEVTGKWLRCLGRIKCHVPKILVRPRIW
jgi:hypothetical protein